MQNRDTSFPYQPYNEYTAFGSNIHHQDLFFTSKALVKILRHQVGQKWGNSIPCNGGGWVDIDHILNRESAFPQDRYKKSDRFQMIAESIRSEDRRARKPRLQILAAKFDQEIDMDRSHSWTKKDIDWIRREHGGWWQPWCIRASSGHSDFGFARPAELCNILFPNMSDRLGGAFHVTKPSALECIFLRGIVPGGNDKTGSTLRSMCTLEQREHLDQDRNARCQRKEGDDLIAIYVPTRKLSVYQSGVTSGMAIWRFKSMKKGPVKEVNRIYSRAVGVTPADFLGNLNNFLDDEDSADADILRKMVVDACVNVGVPNALDKSLVEIRDLLSRFIVYRGDDPSSISNGVCPACAIIVPRDFAIARHANASSFPPASS